MIAAAGTRQCEKWHAAAMQAESSPYAGDHRDDATHGAQLRRTSAYAFTILLSAFLLFQLQPIMGRMVLPWFGGSAAVWTTCMVFFQALLLLGYLYAHGLATRLSAGTQRWVHLALLCVSGSVLPLAAGVDWKPADGGDPTFRILSLLACSAGLPFFVLSATSPLLQAWYARGRSTALPYRLFALSNLGSMAALLSYPVLVEPALTLRQQSVSWSCAYALFVLACTVITWRAGGTQNRAVRAVAPSINVPLLTLALWIVLALCPSAVLLAVTTHLTQNVAPIPLLWVLPLALYLLSFILCFESTRWYRRKLWMPIFVVALAAMTAALLDNGRLLGLGSMIPLFCAGLLALSMVCHGELAALKPQASALTRFYLMIALGGMLGGLFVGLIAPRLFDGYHELPIALLLSAAVTWSVRRRDPTAWVNSGNARRRRGAVLMLALVLAAALAYRPVVAARESRIMLRNFYGVLRTKDWIAEGQVRRTLYHGRIIHGMQLIDGARRHWPTTYYGPESGVGLAIRETRDGRGQRVGVVGLGTGTLAAYGRRADYYAFYEIDPHAIDLARWEFSYLMDSAAAVDVTEGDARLVLDRQAPQRFDVLVVDAFSGDAIPMHLLTREAFALYARHLNADGVLAVHVSNRYLDLAPVVKQSAAAIGMQARVLDTIGDAGRIYYGATWVLATRTPQLFARASLRAALPIEQTLPVWTDDYSSIYRVIR
jgi:SAM-dependent methyltransferase